jgi:CRP/FNR family transcriptional regulator
MKPCSNNLIKSNNYNLLKSIPFFVSFSDKELSVISKIIIKNHFSKNEVVLSEEDTQKYMYIVYSGKVKVVQISVEGKEHIITIHTNGDFFGEMSLLDGKTSPATVIAMEDSEIGLITKDDFERYLLKNEKVLQEIILMLCLRLREAWLMQKVLSFADAENRVRVVLKHISTQYGTKDNRGTIITLKLTHKDIADYASVSRETVTRFLDKFAKDGEIEFLDNKYLLLKPPFKEKLLSV